MRRRLLIIGALVAVVVAAAWYTRGFGLLSPKASPVLTLNGNVDIRQVDLGFRVGGRIASINFEEGSRVPAGALLAAIDTRPLKAQLAVDDAQVAAASAQLEKLRNGNRPQDIAVAEAKVAEAKALLSKSKADFDRRSTLVVSGSVSKADYDNSKSGFGTAEAQLKAAEEALSLQYAGPRREDIEAAVAQKSQAVAQREKTSTDIIDAELHAPNDGVILVRAREPGAIVQPSETVLTLTIDRPMRVRAYIDEVDLGRISPGMAVEVTADSSQKVYHGTVGFISPTAEFTPKTVQTRELRTDLVYRVRIIVEDPDDGLRQGQPVSIQVLSARPPRTS